MGMAIPRPVTQRHIPAAPMTGVHLFDLGDTVQRCGNSERVLLRVRKRPDSSIRVKESGSSDQKAVTSSFLGKELAMRRRVALLVVSLLAV